MADKTKAPIPLKVDGVKAVENKTVTLDEFFEKPTKVEVRVLDPFTRAKIQELRMSDFEISGTGNPREAAKNLTTKMVAEGRAERAMEIRALKLEHGVISHNMTAGGNPVEWGAPLWMALDDMNPAILDKVVGEIDVVTPDKENPT